MKLLKNKIIRFISYIFLSIESYNICAVERAYTSDKRNKYIHRYIQEQGFLYFIIYFFTSNCWNLLRRRSDQSKYVVLIQRESEFIHPEIYLLYSMLMS